MYILFIILIIILSILYLKFKNYVPILMYHRIADIPGDRNALPKEKFAEQLEYLSTHNYHTITPEQLYNHFVNKTKLPKNPVLLTFDDGYQDNYLEALPLLKKYNMTAVVFPIYNWIGKPNKWENFGKQETTTMNLAELKSKMDQAHYIYDDTLATVLAVALELGRPLLIEGAAGVGKTEIAKVMASALDRDLVRLQCYEGLDESKALYEWNYQKQLLSIQVNMASQDRESLTQSLFTDAYLLERPLLKSIRSEKPVVLLIDEIDKADEEFEAFLLELLSEMQVTIPEVGTIRAKTIPFVILTSNRARPLSEALRRRCAYLYIQYPDMEKELSILRAKLPHVDDRLCAQVALAVQKLRSNETILKKPSIAETLDWAAALDALGIRELTPDALRSTAGFILKNSEDLAALQEMEEEGHHCACGGNCGEHSHG